MANRVQMTQYERTSVIASVAKNYPERIAWEDLNHLDDAERKKLLDDHASRAVLWAMGVLRLSEKAAKAQIQKKTTTEDRVRSKLDRLEWPEELCADQVAGDTRDMKSSQKSEIRAALIRCGYMPDGQKTFPGVGRRHVYKKQ